jgi:hypothetical protein
MLCKSGCEHFTFDDPLTWKAHLTGRHNIVGGKGETTPRYNKEGIYLGVTLELDMTTIRIKEEECGKYNK